MDDLVKRLRADSIWGQSVQDTLIDWMKQRKQAADHIEELEDKLAELLAVAKRAVRLSLDHSDFKLYAMEPMHQAIAAAELKG